MLKQLLLVLLLLFTLCLSLGTSLDDAYRILGASPSDSIDIIKKAHRKLALENHPDKNRHCKNCSSKLSSINDAYDKIIYARRNQDSPELKAFFGFSEKLFNLVHDAWGLWDLIPQQEKENVYSSWTSYQSSASFINDIGVLFNSTLRVGFVGFLGMLIFAECKL